MKRFKKQAPFFGIAILLVVALVGGTFAYFSQTSQATNYLTALAYDSNITEQFTPPADGVFAPGVQIDKKVGVTNSGQIPMYVRISYEEMWSNGLYPTVGTGEYATYAASFYDTTLAADNTLISYVKKHTSSTDWVYGNDGYYYYNKILTPGTSTSTFIDYIMMNESLQTQTTVYTVNYYDGTTKALTPITGVTPSNLDDTKASITDKTDGSYLISVISNVTTGAPSGNYTLTFTTETVQAIPDGLNSWTTLPTANSALYTLLNNQIPATVTTP